MSNEKTSPVIWEYQEPDTKAHDAVAVTSCASGEGLLFSATHVPTGEIIAVRVRDRDALLNLRDTIEGWVYAQDRRAGEASE